MVARLLRVIGTVVVVAVASVTPVLATSTPASADTVVNGCTIVSNPTSTNFTNCPGVDLSTANLAGVDLSFANLDGALFANCDALLNCGAADLTGANLTDANLTSTTWSVWNPNGSVAQVFDVDLQNAVLRGANLTNAVFASCTQSGIGTALCGGPTDAEGSGGEANLSGADLTDAAVTGATFGTCLTSNNPDPNQVSENCGGANLTGANLTGVNLTGIDLSGTILVPRSQIVTATSTAGAAVTWPTPPSLPGATPTPGSCTSPSGSTFPVNFNQLFGTAVTCRVVDGQGDITTGTFFVVVNATPDPFVPTTFVGIPSSGATITGGSWLDAGASSPNPGGVAAVWFEVSGGTLSSPQVISGSTPTRFGWFGGWNSTSVPNGTYTLQSVATDGRGESTTSAPITITVNNGPPATAVIFPSNGATQSGSALLDAVSTADVTSVSYELSGGTLTNQVIATGTRTLYGWLAGWNTTSVPNGNYTLKCVGTYSSGTVTSTPITITVSN